jgi:hypothetical protein
MCSLSHAKFKATYPVFQFGRTIRYLYKTFAYLRWFKRIVCRKMNCQEKNTPLEWRVRLLHNKAKESIIRKHTTESILKSLYICSQKFWQHVRILTGPIIVACQWNTKEKSRFINDKRHSPYPSCYNLRDILLKKKRTFTIFKTRHLNHRNG